MAAWKGGMPFSFDEAKKYFPAPPRHRPITIPTISVSASIVI